MNTDILDIIKDYFPIVVSLVTIVIALVGARQKVHVDRADALKTYNELMNQQATDIAEMQAQLRLQTPEIEKLKKLTEDQTTEITKLKQLTEAQAVQITALKAREIDFDCWAEEVVQGINLLIKQIEAKGDKPAWRPPERTTK